MKAEPASFPGLHCATPGQEEEEESPAMIMMPCKKLAHTPTPLLRYFPSKRRHLGGDLLSVHVTEIEAKRKDMEEGKMSHPRNRTRRAHTQSQSSPDPPGGCAIGSQETHCTYMARRPDPMRRWPVHTYTYIRTQIRRAAFGVAAPPLPRTPSVVRPDLGERSGKR